MDKKIISLFCTLSALLALSSCKYGDLLPFEPRDISDIFSLDEAREYFREQARSHFPAGGGVTRPEPLSPGDIVPSWSAAEPSLKGDLACYDVPFSGFYVYQAIFPEDCHGAMVARKVRVYQKLVVVKDIGSNKLSQYILSLIPSGSYDARYKGSMPGCFVTCGDKSGFTGLAVYSCLYTPQIARVDRYEDGERARGVFLLDAANSDEYRERVEEIRRLLSSLTLVRRHAIATRGEYDIDGGWIDEVVVTPETPPDDTGADGMTNDEWADNTWPDDIVDPQPGPDPCCPEDYEDIPDYELGDPDMPVLYGFAPDERDKLLEVVRKLRELKPDVSFRGIRIEKGTESAGYASIDNNGVIYFYKGFFDAPEKDRPAIFYHEYWHRTNEHYKVSRTQYPVSGTMNEPPEELKHRIMEDLRNTYLPYKVSEEFIVASYNRNLVVVQRRDDAFYKNELEAYAAEKSLFPDDRISEAYRLNRDAAIWEYTEKLKILNNNN